MRTHLLRGLAILAAPCLAAIYLLPSPATGQLVPSSLRIPYDSRTPISEIPFVIDDPGSYFVTGNLQPVAAGHGITVNVGHVTIDLNGFALDGLGSAADHAVYAPTVIEDVTVKNGAVHGWNGGLNLVHVNGARVLGIRAHDGAHAAAAGIRVGDNGLIKECLLDFTQRGIDAGDGARIVDCVARDCTTGIAADTGASISGCTSINSFFYGFNVYHNATITNCSATGSSSEGFLVGGSGVVTGCTAADNRHGFRTSSGPLPGAVTFENCVATENSLSGFDLRSDGTVRNCRAVENGSAGFLVTGTFQIVGNSSIRNGGAGVLVSGGENHIEGNTLSFNGGAAFDVSGNYNFIVRNRASVNVGGFIVDTGTGNRVGTLQTTPLGAGPWDNFTF